MGLNQGGLLFIEKSMCHKQIGPRGYKTFFMLNLAEHKINPAHKC